ncbi:MAG: 4Fe-4S binding protein [Endomicrobia bacterium]|nr:4Fe-4S binding protein [Endomicrobiia bacterium]MCX7940737.1 4Fe-4S binding protein [Endomicrobiia bacterium]MDW8056543.1 NIL domain-containing protein [Elusimicrobiota bacterium]
MTKKEVIKKLVLKFPKRLIDQPIVYHLVKDYDLMINILKASVQPDAEGIMVLELSGKKENFDKGINFLKKLGVEIQPLSKDIKFDEKLCYNCGVCVPICPVGALVMDKKTYQVSFDKQKCIACELCIKVCPPRAIKLVI